VLFNAFIDACAANDLASPQIAARGAGIYCRCRQTRFIGCANLNKNEDQRRKSLLPVNNVEQPVFQRSHRHDIASAMADDRRHEMMIVITSFRSLLEVLK
jgi:hypothetical protein